PHTNSVGCAEPREAQPTVGASCASYRQHNLRVWKFAEITLALGFVPQPNLPEFFQDLAGWERVVGLVARV
ncbi:hypothetical protein, partial [Thiocapsa sp. C4-3m]|uniref:hypothetical protein n=1 Tax=Thiocapsa sp. C4-3m TaxID=3137393 RepID=UPI0035B09348